MVLTNRIKALACNEGIDIIKITNPEPFDYALTNSPRRDPHITLPSVQALIIVGIYIGGFDMPDRTDARIGQFSRLILSSFYFDVIEPLNSIIALLESEGYKAILCNGYSQNSVLPLKLAAVRAGIGWQGKSSLLITRDYGSYVALGGIITDAPLQYDNSLPAKDNCGKCQACRNACPMNALEDPYKLNVNRCLSYLLESETLSEEVKSNMGNQVLECDLCQLVCPWNKKHEKAPPKSGYSWNLHEHLGGLDNFFNIANLIQLSEKEFNKHFGYRLAGVNYNIFRRNLMSVVTNSKIGENPI